ncbi:hypothetical protein K2173_023084 [Erythroxylum novogranatense]|uniref:NAD(+) kinase n=1 Tax=Erythroxylum novogranatense TaxID=1862640 RepID=A0AAV8T880_9ROSI|nr:hypothetical protein K2173_023084 [Erythroxylum novogranatense]
MVACLFLHHVAVVDMNLLSPLTGVLPSFCLSKVCRERDSKVACFGSGLEFRRKDRLKRKLKFVVSAELSEAFSRDLGLDSQFVQPNDVSQLRWAGPMPGDIAEVEAYCRIFRAAERLHAALMDALCNPLTGECAVSYDFTSEEKPLLEDKIVSVLGCMLSLLNKGREDVLSGRYSITSSYRSAEISMTEDKLPPLAVFRSEMKRCCESLHVALENFLTPDDARSLDVWRKLQRLKNVCYDCGFPRRDDYPCHTLLANWNSVSLSASREDIDSQSSEIAFWSGGQLTEEGLNWLLQRGFKTIVDLRAEIVRDPLYQAAVDNAILSGKIELIKIPVEARTAPSMDQVEKFATLVSDSCNKPIYLHSKEGMWRTTAMISRWKQYMIRSASQLTTPIDGVLQEKDHLGDLQALSNKHERVPMEQEHGLPKDALDEPDCMNGVPRGLLSPSKNQEGQTSNGAYNGLGLLEKNMSVGDNGTGSSANNYSNIDPLTSQVPPSNVFSKAEMSKFFRTKKISPSTYSSYHLKHLENLYAPRQMNRVLQSGYTTAVGPASEPAEVKMSNGISRNGNLSAKPQNLTANGDNHLIHSTSVSIDSDLKAVGEAKRGSIGETCVSTTQTEDKGNKVKSQSINEYGRTNGVASSTSSDDELDAIQGDMCASATGVVRVQSRRKAEMFLVRTDGFSCSREKVTESSLAFTHPSTQQQMLMWKSTPKTALLLKKLGQELMEEAKEVASFLYHQEKMNVLVEPDVHDIFARIPGFGFVQTFYSQDTSDLHERVDFVACLGGDGVILHASNLFRGAVPPVVSFNLGSLGFLTSHNFEDYRQDLRQVIHGNNTMDGVYITLRMRLRCEIFRNGKSVPGKVFDVLNEVVVDRGSNPYLSKVECYEHDRLITKVQGDGVIVATPTGSTAYSTAAGGSMVHPNVPCMLFTPICPHSLSFRPVILPDSARLELKIPEDTRSNAWVSFDGKRRQQLSRGDSVRIHMSQHPLPTVNKCDQTGDWFRSLIRCLNWNERLDQKAL